MPPVKIVCSSSVLMGQEAFSSLGETAVRGGRTISREDVADADALVVRSTTRIDGALLDGSSVAFVGTATAGFDHIDARFLEEAGVNRTTAWKVGKRSAEGIERGRLFNPANKTTGDLVAELRETFLKAA